MSSQDESVRYIGAGRLHYILKIGLETEPWGEHDLIGCLEYHFIAGIVVQMPVGKPHAKHVVIARWDKALII